MNIKLDYSLLNDWINLNPLTVKEKRLLSDHFIWPFPIQVKYKDKYKNLEKKYFDLLSDYKISINKYNITFGECATDLINNLFDLYVDGDTLVISTTGEHPSVNINLDKCKNKILLKDILNQDNYTNIIYNLETEIKKYKKVFVYVIGTVVLSQESVPEEFFILLKELLIDLGVEYKIVLDDAQGMFLTIRNYNLFDYIIGTAHALTMNYNMGIVIGKRNLPVIGKYYYGLAKKWLKMIKILIRHKDILNQFNNIMIEFYKPYIKENKDLSYNMNSNIHYLFHLNTNYKFSKINRNNIHNNYKIEIESLTSFRFRAVNFLIKPNCLIPSIIEVNRLINHKR